ncbi:molybdopterin-guanine dinucleotide biosynthesis protein B [Alphaproteobacteria bacterium]|nr:molybdopterin-guanine dinucleotide biosynthesis protein B [Alphaproteobacteria bacterium]
MKTIAVIGWKNSGKTTLVSNLVKFFKEKKIKVGVVKHAHHSFDIDHPNTDSYKIRKSGAYKTTLVSDKRLALMEEKITSDIHLGSLIDLNKDCDLLIFEGFKSYDELIKLEVHIKKNHKDYLYKSINNVKYLVTDDDLDHPIQTFNHSQIDKIASEIYNENS